jgi:hypothetical protein
MTAEITMGKRANRGSSLGTSLADSKRVIGFLHTLVPRSATWRKAVASSDEPLKQDASVFQASATRRHDLVLMCLPVNKVQLRVTENLRQGGNDGQHF